VKKAEKDWFIYVFEYIQKLNICSLSESFCELGKVLFSKKGKDEKENCQIQSNYLEGARHYI
jgi:hypothetical protein